MQLFASIGIVIALVGFFRGLYELSYDLIFFFGEGSVTRDEVETGFAGLYSTEFHNALLNTVFSVETVYYFLVAAMFGLTGYFFVGTVNKWLGIISLLIGWLFAGFIVSVFPLGSLLPEIVFATLFYLSALYFPIAFLLIPVIFLIGSHTAKKIAWWKSLILATVRLFVLVFTIISFAIDAKELPTILKTTKGFTLGSISLVFLGGLVLLEAWRTAKTRRVLCPLLGAGTVLLSGVLVFIGAFQIYSYSVDFGK